MQLRRPRYSLRLLALAVTAIAIVFGLFAVPHHVPVTHDFGDTPPLSHGIIQPGDRMDIYYVGEAESVHFLIRCAEVLTDEEWDESHSKCTVTLRLNMYQRLRLIGHNDLRLMISTYH